MNGVPNGFVAVANLRVVANNIAPFQLDALNGNSDLQLSERGGHRFAAPVNRTFAVRIASHDVESILQTATRRLHDARADGRTSSPRLGDALALATSLQSALSTASWTTATRRFPSPH